MRVDFGVRIETLQQKLMNIKLENYKIEMKFRFF